MADKPKRLMRVNRHSAIEQIAKALKEASDNEIKRLYETYVDNVRDVEIT